MINCLRYVGWSRSAPHLLPLLLLPPLLLFSCGKETAEETPLRPVRTLRVVASGGSRVRTFSGAAQAGMESRLSFRVGGEIRRLAVKVGDHARAGQLLAELDRTDYTLQVEQADAALAQASAAQRKADADYERIRQLYENENASRNDLDATRAAFESAAAQVVAVSKQLQLARQQLSYTRLQAPVDCDIASVYVEVNENVQPGDVVVVLTAGSKPEVRVAMPEILIAQISEGGQVDVAFDAIPGETFTGVITEVGVQPEAAATTFPVTVRVDPVGTAIRPGMAAEVAFRFAATDDREHIFVPPVAAGEDRLGRFVFVVESEDGGTGIARRRPVEVGNLTTDGLEILVGLAEGDILVTAGVSKIEDGLRVKLVSATGEQR